MMRTARIGSLCRQSGLVGAVLIGGWLLGIAPIALAAEQSQPEKGHVSASTVNASSNSSDAVIHLAQVVAQSDMQSRLDDIDKRLKALEKWVASQITIKRQHLEDESKLLNELGSF